MYQQVQVPTHSQTEWVEYGQEFLSQPIYNPDPKYSFTNHPSFEEQEWQSTFSNDQIINQNYTSTFEPNIYQESNGYSSPDSSYAFSPDSSIFDALGCNTESSYDNYFYETAFKEQSPISYQEDELSLPSLDDIDLDLILNELEHLEENDFADLLGDIDIATSNGIIDSNQFSPSDSYNFKRKQSIDSTYGSPSPSTSSFSFSSSASSIDYSSSEVNDFSSLDSNFNPVIKKRRNRKSKHTKDERAARKKDQNKRAALKYRSRKKVESEITENILQELVERQNQLTNEFKKIKTEFDVILPLAKAAFQFDPIRSNQLQQLLQRISI